MTQADAHTSENATAAPRHFRWRRLVQYRLRTLLILMTLVAIWFAWWSYHAQQQRAIVAALTKAGADVQYDYTATHDFYQGNRSPLRLHWPDWLVRAIGIDYFASVESVFFHHGATDAELQIVSNLSDLRDPEKISFPIGQWRGEMV